MRLLALTIAVLGVGALAAPPANAMHCNINDQPELSSVCNQVIALVCTPLQKFGGCL
jgi:hypothetical protein